MIKIRRENRFPDETNNCVRRKVPDMRLDEAMQDKDRIAAFCKTNLSTTFCSFGSRIFFQNLYEKVEKILILVQISSENRFVGENFEVASLSPPWSRTSLLTRKSKTP